MARARPTCVAQARSLSRRLRQDTYGNVAMMFGLIAPVLLALAGGAIDFSHYISVKNALNDAADAAALAAVSQSSINSAPGGYTNTTSLQSQARAIFNTDSQAENAVLNSVAVNVTRTNNIVSAQVTYSGSVKTYFGSIIGMDALPVSGNVTSSHGMATYADFYLALDISQSMGLAATDADMANLSSRTNGCAFACHVAQGTSTDNYTVARQNGILLRIDAVRSATSELIDAAQARAAVSGQYRVGLYEFNAGLTLLQSLTPDMPTAKTAAANIDMAIPTSDGRGETDYTSNLPKIAADIPTPGDGTSAASRKAWLFIVTDGVQDVYDASSPTYSYYGQSAAAWGHDTQPIDPGLCTAIKSRGVQIAVLYTTYLSMPTRTEWNTLVHPFSDQVSANLKACASPNAYFEARDSAGIHTAMSAMFMQAVTSARLTH